MIAGMGLVHGEASSAPQSLPQPSEVAASSLTVTALGHSSNCDANTLTQENGGGKQNGQRALGLCQSI